MITCNDWPIGICTWSLNNDFDKIRILREQTRLNHIQLALLPALQGNANYLPQVEKGGWDISATMVQFPTEDYSTIESIKTTGGIVPDEHWDENRKLTLGAIDLTAQLGVKDLTLHFGFIENTGEKATVIRDRVKLLADAAAEKNIVLLMETGQESADELCHFLEEMNHPALGVNFDPANMILYDKDNPLEAVGKLARWIKHIHIKDSIRTKTPGQWGTEVPWGTGQVGGDDFLKALKKINFAGPLAIEREQGTERLDDIRNAINALKSFSSSG